MAARIEVPVLIVGAGPVGLTLAGELGWRGQSCLVVDERTAPSEMPKATLLTSRSMELYRRWGITQSIFACGLPLDRPYRIIMTTRLADHLLHESVNPPTSTWVNNPREAAKTIREVGWSPYFKTQIGQHVLEPVLAGFAEQLAGVELRMGCRFESFEQDENGVCAILYDRKTHEEFEVHAQYLVACDGGNSIIRKELGIMMSGRGAMRPNITFYFRSPQFQEIHGKGHANLLQVYTPDSHGVFTAIDGHELWTYQHYFLDPARHHHPLDPQQALHHAMGKPFDFELLSVAHWFHHQSVAHRWQEGRCFLVGDAAHLFSPVGGIGMNTGIADAIDLGWKLDAVLRGWGGAGLLASYERERRPIAIRNSQASANNSDRVDMIMSETSSEIEADTPVGAKLRAELTIKLRWLARMYVSAGINLGHRYADSPIIAADGSPEPADDAAVLCPSTWPGMRAPHGWLPDGRSTLDLFGRHFVLVAFAPPDDRLARAAAAVGLPLEMIRLDAPDLRALYERDFVLVRPDGHVCWRGDTLPEDPAAVINLVRGAA